MDGVSTCSGTVAERYQDEAKPAISVVIGRPDVNISISHGV